MGAYPISISDKGPAGQCSRRNVEAGLACLRVATDVKYYIVDEFVRGDIICLFTSMNVAVAATGLR
jgi:hypothetical protein